MKSVILGAGLAVLYALGTWIGGFAVIGVVGTLLGYEAAMFVAFYGVLISAVWTLLGGGPAAFLSAGILTLHIRHPGSGRNRYLKTLGCSIALAIATVVLLGVLLGPVRSWDSLLGWTVFCFPAATAGGFGMARGLVLADRGGAS